jgi:hypothetical protein
MTRDDRRAAHDAARSRTTKIRNSKEFKHLLVGAAVGPWYAHDTAARDKHARAKALIEDLWRRRSGILSTQVLQELAVNLRRKAKKLLDQNSTREVVSD